METVNTTAHTIMLSTETAELLNCKKTLDSCFRKIGDTHDRFFARNESFDDKLSTAYAAMNALVMGLIAANIDETSTESAYRFI